MTGSGEEMELHGSSGAIFIVTWVTGREKEVFRGESGGLLLGYIINALFITVCIKVL